jgi:pimeloyl-ACP methyl ester carboxylesterase
VLGFWEVLPDAEVTSEVGHNVCDDLHFDDNEEQCLNYTRFLDVSDDQLNVTMLPIYFDIYPEGSSVKPFVHYGQSINNTGYFRKYDKGSEDANIADYGTPQPPDYNLGSIQLPVYIFYGDSDALVLVDDVLQLASELPNVPLLYEVPYMGWTHNDMGNP